MRVCDFCKKGTPEHYLSFQDFKKKHLPLSPYEVCKSCFVQVESFTGRLKRCKGKIVEAIEPNEER